MSHRRRGRGRGAANPLAPPFNPHATPSSPEDTRMDESIASPVQTVRSTHHETLDDEEELTLQHLAETMDQQIESYNKLLDDHHLIRTTLDALQQYLEVVQTRHIKDTSDLKDQIATLTTHIERLEEKPVTTTTTTPAPPQRPIAPLPTTTWAQKAARAASATTPTPSANKKATPLVLTKRDRTIVIERDGTALPDNTNNLTIRDAINSAIKKPLIATIEFTTNHNIHLITRNNTPATSVLKSHRPAIEQAIRATIPAATGLRKDEIWHKVIIHGIPTTSSFSTVQSEVQDFNPGTHLPRPPRWLTTEAQRSQKSASTMVLTIAGKEAADKAISSGLSLFGKKFKVQKYLTFGPDTQCSKCLAFGHHTTRCANPTHCTFCAGDHPAYLHTCGRSDCPTKGKPCLHTTLKCSNCGDNHQADSEECQTYQDAHQEATERRNRAD